MWNLQGHLWNRATRHPPKSSLSFSPLIQTEEVEEEGVTEDEEVEANVVENEKNKQGVRLTERTAGKKLQQRQR
eukprot:g37053.t1